MNIAEEVFKVVQTKHVKIRVENVEITEDYVEENVNTIYEILEGAGYNHEKYTKAFISDKNFVVFVYPIRTIVAFYNPFRGYLLNKGNGYVPSYNAISVVNSLDDSCMDHSNEPCTILDVVHDDRKGEIVYLLNIEVKGSEEIINVEIDNDDKDPLDELLSMKSSVDDSKLEDAYKAYQEVTKGISDSEKIDGMMDQVDKMVEQSKEYYNNSLEVGGDN